MHLLKRLITSKADPMIISAKFADKDMIKILVFVHGLFWNTTKVFNFVGLIGLWRESARETFLDRNSAFLLNFISN